MLMLVIGTLRKSSFTASNSIHPAVAVSSKFYNDGVVIKETTLASTCTFLRRQVHFITWFILVWEKTTAKVC